MEGAPLQSNQVAPEPGGDGAGDAPGARGSVGAGKMSTVLHAMTLRKAGDTRYAAGTAHGQLHQPAGVSIKSLGGKCVHHPSFHPSSPYPIPCSQPLQRRLAMPYSLRSNAHRSFAPPAYAPSPRPSPPSSLRHISC